MEKRIEVIYGKVLNFVKKYKTTSICCLFLFILASPAIFTRSCAYSLDFSETGQIGDTFAIMNPFIAIVAAVLTFVAFWTQYKANKEMLENNDKQQEERQFYEMLKIHKDNVNTLKMDALINDREITVNGMLAMRLIRIEFTNIFLLVLFELEQKKSIDQTFVIDKNQAFHDAYEIFFRGNKWNKIERLSLVYRMIEEAQKGKTTYANGTEDDSRENMKVNPIKFALGHIEEFDPYYRHLYHMVKSIVLSKKFNDEEKMRYLKILRAQMTSDEQILLLYNWFSGYGEKWESEKVNQYFFSKYYMIHNIFPDDSIFEPHEIYNMFPHVSDEDKMNMFEHIDFSQVNRAI